MKAERAVLAMAVRGQPWVIRGQSLDEKQSMILIFSSVD